MVSLFYYVTLLDWYCLLLVGLLLLPTSYTLHLVLHMVIGALAAWLFSEELPYLAMCGTQFWCLDLF